MQASLAMSMPERPMEIYTEPKYY